MKRSLIAIAFLLLHFVNFASIPVDSLQFIWTDQTLPVEERLKSLNYACDKFYLRSNPDSAFILAVKMFKLADSSGTNIYKAEALRIQGESYHYQGDIEQAIKYLEESLHLSTKLNYNKGMATSLSCLGNILTELGKYTDALDHYNKSLEINNMIPDKIATANTLIAMGIIYYDLGDSPRSLSLLERALELNREVNDIRGMGRINNNIGVIYHKQANFNQADEYFKNALEMFEAAGEQRGIASTLNNIGDLYASQGNYIEALPYNFKSLNMRKELGDKRGMANCYNVIGNNYTKQGNFSEALKYYLLSVDIREELDEKRAMSRVYGNIGQLFLIQQNYVKSEEWCKKSFELSRLIGAKMEEKESCDCLYKTHKNLGEIEKALNYHERLIEIVQELKSEETAKTLQEHEFKKLVLEDSIRKKQERHQIELMHKEEVNQKNRQRNIFIFIGLAILLLSGGLYSRLHYIRKSRSLIQKEKERSDELLLNILPEETANELKLKGFVDAQHFDQVTVMFTDFKGFTQWAEQLTPNELVSEIDYCFKQFDQIISKYNIEKIKTIGDAYMCAGGLPKANDTNPVDVVKAGLEIQKFMQELKESKIAENKPYFELRLGIHTGSVVAGIVGFKKFQYDIWGDTVNIAARMESSGEVGKVNISQMTYDQVKDHFKCEHRGKIKAKNKGAIDMYFAEAEL